MSQIRWWLVESITQTALEKPRVLNKLIKSDELGWYSAKEEALGDLYEGLLSQRMPIGCC